MGTFFKNLGNKSQKVESVENKTVFTENMQNSC